MNRWWFKTLGQELGPLSIEQLIDLARRGVLSRTDKVHRDGEPWVQADIVLELSGIWSTESPDTESATQPVNARLSRPPETSQRGEHARAQAETTAKSAADALQKMLAAATRGKGTRQPRHPIAEQTVAGIEIAGDEPQKKDLGPPLDIDAMIAEAHAPSFSRVETPKAPEIFWRPAGDRPKRRVVRFGLAELAVFASGIVLGLQLFPKAFWGIIVAMDVRGWSPGTFAVWNVVVVVLLVATRHVRNAS